MILQTQYCDGTIYNGVSFCFDMKNILEFFDISDHKAQLHMVWLHIVDLVTAIPGAVPLGFHCQSIGSTGKRCPYFHGYSGTCCNMDMCLSMHLVTNTKAKELSKREKNNEKDKLDITNSEPYAKW